MRDQVIKISRFLSLVLRHRPGKIGIVLDRGGWVLIEELLTACGKHGFSISREALNTVVAANDKKRFSYSEDGQKIRANQGHSIIVNLGYEPVKPPELLYHGTDVGSVRSILQNGIKKGGRHHVHLSLDAATAKKVGARHGRPVVLVIRAREMHHVDHQFFVTSNGVWLTENVPPEFIDVP